MVERHPHTFTLTAFTASVKDVNGNVINQPPALQMTVKGRAKVAGNSQKTILSDNGDVSPFSHTVTLPYFTEDFTNGKLTWGTRTYPIIRFRQYQNRCKIWI